MTFEEAVRELYSCDPSEFVGARSDLVSRLKEDGERALAGQVAALRKPTVAAWAVNGLARHAADELAALLDLGPALRAAQRDLSAERLRALTTERQRAVNGLVRRAGALAAASGRALAEPVLREVGRTLNAALADPAIAEQVVTGALSTAAAYEGFGPESPALSVVRTAGPPRETGTAETAERSRDAARRAPAARPAVDTAELDRARAEHEESTDRVDAARTALEQAREQVAQAEERLRDLRAQVEHTEQQRRFALTAEQHAREDLRKRQAVAEKAGRRVTRARERLDADQSDSEPGNR